MTIPSVIGVAPGSGSTSNGGNAYADFTSSGRIAGDFLILIVETPNRAVTVPSADWTQFSVGQPNVGSAGAAGGVRLAGFYKVSDGTEGQVHAASTSSSHSVHTGIVIRGVDTTNPINAIASAGLSTGGTALSWPDVITTVNDSIIVNLLANDRDALSVTNLSSIANANLSNLTLQADGTVATDVGGGIGIITGGLATAGDSGNTTATNASSANAAYITVALTPASVGGSASITPDASSLASPATSATLSGVHSSTAPNSDAQTHSAASPSIVAHAITVPDGATQAGAASSPTVGNAHSALTPDSDAQGHAAAVASLTAKSSAVPDSAAQTHSAASPALSIRSGAVAADAVQSNAASVPAVVAKSVTSPADSAQAASAGSASLSAHAGLAVNGASHVHSAGQPTVSFRVSLPANDNAQLQPSGSPVLSPRSSLAPSSAAHAQIAVEPTLLAQGLIVVTVPADRILTFSGVSRVITLTGVSRSIAFSGVNRIITLKEAP